MTAGERFETVTSAALPAWQIESELQLGTSPAFGMVTATRMLQNLVGEGPSDSGQVALAQFDRCGFKAAAITNMTLGCAMILNDKVGVERTVELRSDHPFAAIAVCRGSAGKATRFGGLPVFEAWIDSPIEVPVAV